MRYTHYLTDFPRGGRILRLGLPDLAVEKVEYRGVQGSWVRMEPGHYLRSGDRLILARDVWPAVSAESGARVRITYITS